MTAAITGVPPDSVLPQVCTPCMAKLDARPWHRTLAVRTGPIHIGVRVDTPATAAALEELLAPLRAPEMDARVSPNFSVEMGDGAEDVRRRLHLVYRDHEIVGRRRGVEALLLDLVELLDEVPKRGITERPVVHATGVVSANGEAILFPGRYHKALLTRRQRLAEAGLELLRTRTQRVDTEPSELVLDLADGSLSELLTGRCDERTVSGRFPLRAWCVPALGDEPFDLRPAEGVVAAFAMVLNRQTMGTGPVLRALSHVPGDSRFVAVPELSPSALTATLIRLGA